MLAKPILAFCFLLITPQLPAQTIVEDSTILGSNGEFELLQQGASIGRVHGTYLGKRPELPILDKDGNVHPASCNPHINFFSKELDKTKLQLLLPHLAKLRPDNRASHAALYLPRKLHSDKLLVAELKKQLPFCQIFFEHHIANSHKVPINRPSNRTAERGITK